MVVCAGAGAISLILGWALDFSPPFLMLLPLIFFVLTAGSIGHIFFLSWEKIARQVKEEMEKEAVASREQQLNDLYRRLGEDDDPKTEKLLQDLREISNAIRESSLEQSRLDIKTAFDIILKEEQLFAKCVERLELSLQLWSRASRISNPEVKEKLLNLRQSVLGEIEKTTSYLGDILARIQGAGYKEGGDKADLLSIIGDLQDGIAIAEKADKRMKELDNHS
ncbi:MAG: hypothetical protein A2351_02170 [Omnitrophica bacterium RIFOXYB12_FULL_50_7]|nr:MAG: hypothetical protein A2351_02170 [Omnitrophica bacterium RIFOXYB12_FULL_50_7]